MAKVKIGIARLNASETLLKASHVITQITGNANFPSPTPTILQIMNAHNALLKATDEAMGRDHEKVALRKIRHHEMKLLMSQLAYYVQDASGGDEEKIISSGFETVAPPSRVPLLLPPENLTAFPKWEPGKIMLRWKRIYKAHGYIVEMTEGNPEDQTLWKPIAFPTKAKQLITGLKTGHVYWFRIKAINPAGVSGPSDPARSMAL
jgi:hypothetical protein